MELKIFLKIVIGIFVITIISGCSYKQHSDELHNNGEILSTNEKVNQQNESFNIILEDDTYTVGELSDLIIILNNNNKPLSNAEVELEVWEVNTEKRGFIKMKPNKEITGQYIAQAKFNKTTDYNIVAHVNTQEAHVMNEFKITVK